MIRLGICGAGGRMGSAILSLAVKDKDIQVTGLVEAPGYPLVGKDVQGVALRGGLREVVDKCDVIIDFTSPASTLENAQVLARSGKALVVGTTGLQGKDRELFIQTVKAIPVVFSPNMSLGANLLFEYVEAMARLLPGYDAEIVEIHHNLKKDAPSGTAHRLAESVQRGKQGGDFVYGRQGLVGERKPSEIGVHALRGGDVVGDHTVFFMGNGERVELIHRVTSREAFANGALTAAKWLGGKPAGLYDMRDVLGFARPE